MDYSKHGNKRRKRLQNPHATRVRNKIGLLVMRVTLAVVLIAGFAGVGAAIGIYIGILEAAPDLDIERLGPISPHSFGTGSGQTPLGSLTSFIVGPDGEERERIHGGQDFEFAGIDEMPQHLMYAFVAIEDERFFEHNGVDPRGIMRAIHVTTMPDRPTEGASTITQQLVKNMLQLRDNTFISKLQEQHLAINFERYLVEYFSSFIDQNGQPLYEDPYRAAKDFILQSYLNIIYLGRGNNGVQAASQWYFGVNVSELTLAQSAVIAAITQWPSRFAPDIRPADNWGRTVFVLRNMLRLGFITEEEYEEARQERQYVRNGIPQYDADGEPRMVGYVMDTIFRTAGGGVRPRISNHDCFTDALLIQVRDDLMRELNLTAQQANHRIFNGGLRIYSTQDMSMQATVDRVFLDDTLWPGQGVGFAIEVHYHMTVFNTITRQYRHHFHQSVVPNLEAAHAFVETVDAQRLAATDEVIWDLNRHANPSRVFMIPQPQGAFVLMDHHTGHVMAIRGIRGPKEGNRVFCRATQARRQPGSQLKPLIPFGVMFDLGLMQPSTVIDDVPYYLPNPYGRGWSPGNWWNQGATHRGFQTVRQGIYESLNVVSARAASDPSIVHAGMPQMRRFLENLGISTLHPNDGPAIVLGGMTEGVYLLELTAAFAAVANMGEYLRPVLYTRVLDHEGRILLENNHEPQRAMRDTTAYLILNSMLRTVTNGTGGRAHWTAAELRAGGSRHIPIAGKTGTSQDRRDLGFVGSTPYFTAAIWMGNDNNQPMHQNAFHFHTPIWRIIMEEVHAGLPALSFERPARIVSAQVCFDSGHLPTELCRTDPRGSRVRSEIFEMGLVPSEQCHVHQQFTYCRASGMLATDYCPTYYGFNDDGYPIRNVITRIGLVRPQPIDDLEIPSNVTIQHVNVGLIMEFPLAVREGYVCNHHGWWNAGHNQEPDHGGHNEWDNPMNHIDRTSPQIWCLQTGQWIPNPNFDPNHIGIPGAGGGNQSPGNAGSPFGNAQSQENQPPQHGGNQPEALPPGGQDEQPHGGFLNTVPIPGLPTNP